MCPKCGLVQPPAPKCKACGSILGHSAPSSTPHQAGVRRKANSVWPVWLAIAIGLAICGPVLYHLWDASLVGYRSKIASATQALKALESATNVGITYQEYSRRLIDTRILVDRSRPGKMRRRAVLAAYRSIDRTMGIYAFAAKVWQAKIRTGVHVRGYYYSEEDVTLMLPLLEEVSYLSCPALSNRVLAIPVAVSPEREHTAKALGYYDEAKRGLPYEERLGALLASVPVIWECASDEIAHIPGARS